MDQLQDVSTKYVVKAKPRLDTIPEDVALQIARFIQSWAEIDGSRNEREKARRSADFTLRGISLTCRTNFSIYHPILLTNVTLTMAHIAAFHQLLQRNEQSGTMIKSLAYDRRSPDAAPLTEEDTWAISLSFLSESEWAASADGLSCLKENVNKSIKKKGHEILSMARNLETLIIHDPIFIPAYQERIDGRLKPLQLLSNSLKRLQIGLVKEGKINLNVKNVIWLLVFCPCLKSASFRFEIHSTWDDFNFLLFHQPSFARLSNVVELSLRFSFMNIDSDKKWWNSNIEAREGWVGQDRKGFALFQLFSVTKNLTSLELFHQSKEGEDPWLCSECLDGLQSSFESLHHLRLPRVSFDNKRGTKFKYSFNHLKVLSLGLLALGSLVRYPQLGLPDSLETIILLHHSLQVFNYSPTEIQEETWLNKILNSSRPFPKLKEVLVPLLPMDFDAELINSAAFRARWDKNRAELKASRIFRNGKVELKTFKAGQIPGSPSQAFDSYLRWLSP